MELGQRLITRGSHAEMDIWNWLGDGIWLAAVPNDDQ